MTCNYVSQPEFALKTKLEKMYLSQTVFISWDLSNFKFVILKFPREITNENH